MRSHVVAAAVTVALVAALVTTASAQPGITAPLAPPGLTEGPPPPRAALPKTGPGAHRPAVAFFVGFGVDIGMLIAAEKGAFDNHEGLGLAALVIAPSAGRWTIGQVGILGMGMRLGGLGLIASGIGGNEAVPIFGGIGLMLTGIVYDLIGAPISADRQNKRRWAAMPTTITSPSGSRSPGLAFGGSF